MSEPDTETVVRGPREGFIESAEDNIALLRKRLKTVDFKTEKILVGDYTKTSVYVAYLKGKADEETVFRVKDKISKIKATIFIVAL